MTAILSLTPFQERQQWEGFRSRAHDALDRCLDRWEARMTEPGSSAPALMEITAALAEERAGLTSSTPEIHT